MSGAGLAVVDPTVLILVKTLHLEMMHRQGTSSVWTAGQGAPTDVSKQAGTAQLGNGAEWVAAVNEVFCLHTGCRALEAMPIDVFGPGGRLHSLYNSSSPHKSPPAGANEVQLQLFKERLKKRGRRQHAEKSQSFCLEADSPHPESDEMVSMLVWETCLCGRHARRGS